MDKWNLWIAMEMFNPPRVVQSRSDAYVRELLGSAPLGLLYYIGIDKFAPPCMYEAIWRSHCCCYRA